MLVMKGRLKTPVELVIPGYLVAMCAKCVHILLMSELYTTAISYKLMASQ